MNTYGESLPEVSISEKLEARCGIKVAVDAEAVATYLADRNLSEQAIAETAIHICSQTTRDRAIGRPLLGIYEPDKGVVAFAPTIVSLRAKDMIRSRSVEHTSWKQFWTQATTTEKFNYILLHELEHRIDDASVRLGNQETEEIPGTEGRERLVDYGSVASMGALLVGFKLMEHPTLAEYMSVGLPLLAATFIANAKMTQNIRYNDYINRPDERRANAAGLAQTIQLVEVSSC